MNGSEVMLDNALIVHLGDRGEGELSSSIPFSGMWCDLDVGELPHNFAECDVFLLELHRPISLCALHQPIW